MSSHSPFFFLLLLYIIVLSGFLMSSDPSLFFFDYMLAWICTIQCLRRRQRLVQLCLSPFLSFSSSCQQVIMWSNRMINYLSFDCCSIRRNEGITRTIISFRRSDPIERKGNWIISEAFSFYYAIYINDKNTKIELVDRRVKKKKFLRQSHKRKRKRKRNVPEIQLLHRSKQKKNIRDSNILFRA